MKVLIVDDEQLSRKRLRLLLEDSDFKFEIEESSNGNAAISKIDAYKPQLVFLDINLKDMTGFDVLKKIKLHPKPLVIFVTAYDYHAIKAFEVNAFDFLLKPFKDARFYGALEKVKNQIISGGNRSYEKQLQNIIEQIGAGSVSDNYITKLPVKQGKKTILVNIELIHLITGSGYYSEIITAKKKYLIRESLKNLIKILNPKQFHRIHRSTIINLDFIDEIIHSDFSETDVKMSDGTTFHVSKSNKKDFFNKLGI